MEEQNTITQIFLILLVLIGCPLLAIISIRLKFYMQKNPDKFGCDDPSFRVLTIFWIASFLIIPLLLNLLTIMTLYDLILHDFVVGLVGVNPAMIIGFEISVFLSFVTTLFMKFLIETKNSRKRVSDHTGKVWWTR